MSNLDDLLGRDGARWRAETDRRHATAAAEGLGLIGTPQFEERAGRVGRVRRGWPAHTPLYLSLAAVTIVAAGLVSAVAISAHGSDGADRVLAPGSPTRSERVRPSSPVTERTTAATTGGSPTKTIRSSAKTTPARRTSATSAPPSPPTRSTTAHRPVGIQCGADDLTVRAGHGAGTGGHGGFSLSFTNRSKTACTLTGYPGVAALTRSGAQAIQAERTPSGYQGGLPNGQTTIPTVRLQPGGQAQAHLEWIEAAGHGQTSCPTYPAVLVTPPNTTGSTRLTTSPAMYVCSHLEIHPVLKP